MADPKKTTLTVATSVLALVGIIIGGWWATESRFDNRYAPFYVVQALKSALTDQADETKKGFNVVDQRLLELSYQGLRRRYFEFEDIQTRRKLTPIEKTEYYVIVDEMKSLREKIDRP